MMEELGNDIHENEEMKKQTQDVEAEADDWFYSRPVEDEHSVPQSEAAIVTTREMIQRYPTRNRRPPERLIYKTVLNVCMYLQSKGGGV